MNTHQLDHFDLNSFCIQVIKGLPVYDFGQSTIEAIYAQNWYSNSQNLKYILSKTPIKNSIPVGTIQFCKSWFELNGFELPKPKNIPESLLQFCTITNPRNISVTDGSIEFGNRLFIKSNDIIKHQNNGFTNSLIPNGNWQVSKIIENISSEYRMFFYRDLIVDIKKYSGNYKDNLNIDHIQYIEHVFKAYRLLDNPTAGTMDFFITDKNEIQLLEVHDWFSCGHYGFDSKYIVNMYISWFRDFIRYKK